MPEIPRLTEEIVLQGGWNPKYAHVLRIEQEDRAAVALVDGNGDGAEIEAEVWNYQPDDQGGWSCTASWGHGSKGRSGHLAASNCDTVFIAGYGEPGQCVTVRWAGVEHEVTADRDGIWVFVAEDPSDDGHALPEVVA